MMDASRQIGIDTTEILSQNGDVKQSNYVALTMGAFSIVLLLVVSLILSILHNVFA